MESTCSLISLDVYDWVSDLKQINLNEVQKYRRCELLLVAEKSFAASTRLKMIERCHHANHAQDVHIITLSDIYDFVENRQTSKIYIDKSIERITEAACREAVRYSRTCDPIPTDLLVTLIKLKIIYVIKKDAHEAQRDVVFDQRNRILENPTPAGAKVKGKRKKAKSKTRKKAKSKTRKKSKKKSKGKKSAVQEDVCLPYLVQKTEEKAFPSDGVSIPDKVLYVVLMGFYMADIFERLISAEMTLSCVIEINERQGLHATSSTEPEINHVLAHKHYNSRQFRNKNDTLCTFWSNLYDVFFRNKNPQARNSFIVTYSPMIIIKNQNGNTVVNSQQMFEHFAEAVRRIDEYRMWHGNYLEKLKVFGLGETPEVIPVYCMDAYNDALNELPIECVNVGIVLDGLLGEVCHRVDNLGRRKSTEKILGGKLERPRDFRGQLKRLLAYLKCSKGRIPIKGFEPVPSTKYILKDRSSFMHERSFLERKLHCYNNLHRAILNTYETYLRMNGCVKLWEKYPAAHKTSTNMTDFNKQLKELCPIVNLNTRNLLSCIIVFLIGKIDCASEDEESKVARETTEMEKYFPNRNNDLQAMLKPEPEVTDCREGNDSDSLNIYEQLLLHKFAWMEDLPPIVFLQVLNEALDEYECVDHIYVPVFDSVHLHFHHSADKFGIVLDTWSAKIRSPVDLNSFLTFVVHEDGEFVMSEQRRQEELNQLYQEIVEKETRRINLVEISDEVFIVKGSIKDQLRRASLQVDEKKVKPKKGKKKRGKGSKKSSGKKKSGKGTKKTKSTRTKKSSGKSSAKTAFMDVRSIVENKLQTQVDMKDVENAFNVRFPPKYLRAYDFERRTAVIGSATTFYSLDPMKIVVNRYMLTGKSPKISVNLTMNDHTMMLHAYVHEGFDFHFRARNGTAIAFGKESELNGHERPMKKLQDVYLLNEKRIRSIRCVNQNLILKRKLLVRAQYLQQIIDMMKKTGKDAAPQATKFSATLSSNQSIIASEDFKISRKQFLDELKQVKATTSVFDPRFKICSSRLHKYSQVKRVVSPVALQLQQLRKFLNCRDDCGRHRLLQVKKCFPIPGGANLVENHPDYDLRVTLENGLHIRSIPGLTPHLYYINQFFIKKGPQHVNVATEESRTFLRCGFIAVKHLDGTLMLFAGDGRVIKFDVPLAKRRKKFDFKFQRKTDRNEGDRKFLKILRRQLRRLDRRASNGRRDSQFEKSRYKYDCTTKKIRYNSELSLLTVTDDDDMSFTLIMTDGKRIKFKKGKMLANDCYYVTKEDEILENKSVYRREDGTQIVLTHDGYMQTTYVDGTRITNWFEVNSDTLSVDLTGEFGAEVEDMGVWVIIDIFYQFEHPNYATVTCSSTTNVMKLQTPGGIILEHRNDDEYLLKMDESTTAKISKDTVQVESLPCEECKKQCWCTFNITQLYQLQRNIPGEETLLMASDTYNKTLIVNYDGSCSRSDNYDRSETNCDHILHKKQNLQAFFVMKRDCSGQLMWTEQMYNDRLLESQLAPNQTAVFYADKETSVIQTAEFRVYETGKYHDRFTMPYLPTIVPYYKEPPFDFESATFATQRLLQSIPDFRISAPIYMTLINQLLASKIPSKISNSQLALLGKYLATKSDLLSLSKGETAPVCKRIARNIFSKKIAEWKRQCQLGRQAVLDFHKVPQSFYDFDLDKEPSDDKTKTSTSGENSSPNQSNEEKSLEVEEPRFRSMGTNTLIPFCIETELEAQRKQEREEDTPESSSTSSETDEGERAECTPEVLKNKLLDCITDILGNYGITIDEDESTLTPEKHPEMLKSESDDGSESDASSVPEFLKGATYRAVFKLFADQSVKRPRVHVHRHKEPLKDAGTTPVAAAFSAIDSIVTQADSWLSPEQDIAKPLEKTLSMKVLSSKVMHHPSYTDAELILKVKSSEMRKIKQSTEDVNLEEGKTVGISLHDLSSEQHHCRDCLGVAFVRQDESLYQRGHFLDR